MSFRAGALALALSAVTCAGCAASVDGSGGYAGGAPAPTATDTTTDTATGTTGTTTSASPTSTSAPAPSSTSPATTAAPPPAGGDLEDQGWLVASTSFTPTLGIFFGTAEITNTATTPRSGIFTLTLSKGGTVIATLIGSADTIPAGQTATVDLIGGDTFVEGPYDVLFEVSFTY
ncbi:MAG: hypothetical protein H0T85_08250 [Geodermatophilaceae bacterium]|nr:hypothetical protein [Geodermatophilaceae bacterium]